MYVLQEYFLLESGKEILFSIHLLSAQGVHVQLGSTVNTVHSLKISNVLFRAAIRKQSSVVNMFFCLLSISPSALLKEETHHGAWRMCAAGLLCSRKVTLIMPNTMTTQSSSLAKASAQQACRVRLWRTCMEWFNRECTFACSILTRPVMLINTVKGGYPSQHTVNKASCHAKFHYLRWFWNLFWHGAWF